MAEAALGDTSAFEELVRRHQDHLFGLLQRLVGDRESARDLTQEAFLKAWRGLPAFEGRSAFFTWLYRIARNGVLSAGRRARARPHITRGLAPPGPLEESGRIDPPDSAAGPEEMSMRMEQRQLVLEAISGLPPDFREVVVLRDMHDHSYDEIADLLGIAVGTVRSRLHRARLCLRERLKKLLHSSFEEPFGA